MALVVEDGTGLANADAYIEVAFADSYLSGRGLALTGADADKEKLIREATQYLDTMQRFKGRRLTATQSLEFPRDGLIDWSSYAVVGVPNRVKWACALLAFIRQDQSDQLYQNQDRGGKVKSEAVGPISTTYTDDAPAEKLYQEPFHMLKPYLRDPSILRGGPLFGGRTEATFEVGMHDNPNQSSTTQ